MENSTMRRVPRSSTSDRNGAGDGDGISPDDQRAVKMKRHGGSLPGGSETGANRASVSPMEMLSNVMLHGSPALTKSSAGTELTPLQRTSSSWSAGSACSATGEVSSTTSGSVRIVVLEPW